MNSRFMAAQARHFAQRILKETGPASPAREQTAIVLAYRLAYARRPQIEERGAARAFLKGQRTLYMKAKKAEAEAELQAYADFCHALLSANEFLYVD
jgi:hypothetical protein